MPSSEIEAAFRQVHKRVVTAIVARFGPGHLDLAEDSCQNAMVKAWMSWPNNGIPHDPAAWLYRVATRSALDELRRKQNVPLIESLSHEVQPLPTGQIQDDLLLMSLCSHPAIPGPSKTALILRLVIGLSSEQIARALQTSIAAVDQRVSRAKREFNSLQLESPLPLSNQVPRIAQALYLTFNEGYLTTSGKDLTEAPLCAHAISLGQSLASSYPDPTIESLLALMLFQASRLRARVDDHGALITLPDQDRRLWDHEMVRQGMSRLEKAINGGDTSPYLHEAAIASCHATAPTYADTDWPTVLAAFDDLLRLRPTGVVALNRCIALAEVEGAQVALRVAKGVATEPDIAETSTCAAVLAYLHEKCGDTQAAADSYRLAAELTTNLAEREHLKRKGESLAKRAT